MKERFAARLAGALFAGTCLSGMIGAADAQDASSKELKTINFMSTNHKSCSSFPQMAMQEFGFLEEQGYKLNMLNTDTAVPYAAFLANGDADLAIIDPGAVLQAANAGQPIKAVYETHQVLTDFIVVMADSPVKKLQDLEGKIIGIASDKDVLTTAIALGVAGMTIDQVKTVVVGDSGPVLAKSLRDGTIDAFTGGTTDRAGIIAAGLDIRNVTPPELLRFPGNSMAVWGPTLEEKRPLIQAFLKAWAMATQAGVYEQTAVYMACKKRVPEQWEQAGVGPRIVDNSIYNVMLRRTVKYGELQPDVWTAMEQPYIKAGELKGPIDVSTFLDSSFIDGANDFTTDDVKKGIAKFHAANPDMEIPQ